jgi:vacuolar-type H+-ATPase subunit E/Vma4
MSATSLTDKILADAETEVASIKDVALQETQRLQQQTEDAVNALRKEHDAKVKKAQAQIELVARSKAKQVGHIALQRAKRRAVDEIFQALETELIGQTSETYVTFFGRYASTVLGAVTDIVRVEAPKNRLTETKQILDNLGLVAEIIPQDSVLAGFILYARDGVYDVTLRRLLEEKKLDLEMEIARQVKGS